MCTVQYTHRPLSPVLVVSTINPSRPTHTLSPSRVLPAAGAWSISHKPPSLLDFPLTSLYCISSQLSAPCASLVLRTISFNQHPASPLRSPSHTASIHNSPLCRIACSTRRRASLYTCDHLWRIKTTLFPPARVINSPGASRPVTVRALAHWCHNLIRSIAMLLPSAFSCDGGQLKIPDSRPPQRPKLPSFAAYQPLLLAPSTQSRPSPLSSSCRALHAILGAPAAIERSIPSPPRQRQDPFKNPQTALGSKQIPPPTPCRGANKRRRSDFEADLAPSDTIMQDCPQTPQPVRTPKRRRKVPLYMPMGLSAEDFHALETPPEETVEPDLDMPIISPFASNNNSDRDSAYGSSPSIDDPDWTIDDDRLLVETVLEKLKLSKRDWNECARKLGKDKDSLGRRWSLLVGEGNVGLRRGRRISRTDLDIASW